MTEIYVVNVKCNGCANTIKKELRKVGFKNIKVCFTENDSYVKRKVLFEGDKDKALEILENFGYPEYGTEKAKSYMKKAKSFVSCAIGKIDLKSKE